MHEEIDSCKWIYLRELLEPEENSLRLVVSEAKANGPPEDIEVLPGKLITGSRAIVSDESCRFFELLWPTYVTYSVRNESYCILDESEKWTGRLLLRYTQSKFLEYVSRATFASDEYPGPLKHWGVNCLNHIVDVCSTSDPLVRRIKPAKLGANAGLGR